jgi:hypothetical protein
MTRFGGGHKNLGYSSLKIKPELGEPGTSSIARHDTGSGPVFRTQGGIPSGDLLTVLWRQPGHSSRAKKDMKA